MGKVYFRRMAHFTDAEQDLTTFIVKVDDEKRRHSNLGCLHPAEFEANCTPVTDDACITNRLHCRGPGEANLLFKLTSNLYE